MPDFLPEDLTSSSSPPPVNPITTATDATSDPSPRTPSASFGVSDGANSRWSIEQLGANPYGMYSIDTSYETWTGFMGMPVAAPQPADQEIIQVCQGYTKKVVQWTCERLDARPILPHWDTGNANEVLKYRRILPASTTLTIDSKQVWRVSGTYVYELKRAVDDTSRYFCGAPPFDTSPSSLQVIDGSLFSRQILNAV